LKKKEPEKSESGKNSAKNKSVKKKSTKNSIYPQNYPDPPKGVGESRVEARIFQTNVLYCTVFKIPVLWTTKPLPSSL
jgi:hypothetical protein